jgi:adenylylsulfate kinase
VTAPDPRQLNDTDSRYSGYNQSRQSNGSVIWFEGLSAAGKTTIAGATQQRFEKMGMKSILLDGDQFRRTHSRDLGFSREDRSTNILRAGNMARRFAETGLIVLAAFITPFAADRISLRKIFSEIRYIEVFCDCPIKMCAQRDPKGLYQLAKMGQITDFTGITSPFEYPRDCDLVLATHLLTLDQCVHKVLSHVSYSLAGNPMFF